MTLKLTIPKKRQAIPKRVQQRLHRESKYKRRKVQSESSDDELICFYGDDKKRSRGVLNREIRLRNQSAIRSSRSIFPSGDDDSSDENISTKLRDAGNAAKCVVSSSSSSIKIKRHRLHTSNVSPESDESSDDELVAFRKVQRSEESDDELVTGPKVRRGGVSDNKLVAVSKVRRGEDSDDELVAMLKMPISEDSDDEIVVVPKLSLTPLSRVDSEKRGSTSIYAMQLRESESDIVSDDKFVQKITGTEEGSLKIVVSCKETNEKGEKSSSEDEFISISKSVSNGASVNRKEQGTTGEDRPLNSCQTNGSSSKALKSTLSDSDSDDEPISITRKKKVGNHPSGVSNSQVNSKKRSTKKKKAASKKPKKVYDMPGQKKDKPGELNGARIFYESLREQIPDSIMAEEYLLKYGLLSFEEATAIVEGKSLKSRSAIKTNNTEKSAKWRSPKIKEILSGDSSSDADIILTKKVKIY